jgi:hypothetical protein
VPDNNVKENRWFYVDAAQMAQHAGAHTLPIIVDVARNAVLLLLL